MVECELCKAMEYSKDYSFVSRLCRGCLETSLAEWVELFNQKQSQWVDAKAENAKLREGISRSIADGCGGLSPPCDACIVLQKLLAETETGEHPPKTNPSKKER